MAGVKCAQDVNTPRILSFGLSCQGSEIETIISSSGTNSGVASVVLLACVECNREWGGGVPFVVPPCPSQISGREGEG